VNNCKHLKSRVLREWPHSCQLHLPARGSLAFRYRGTRSSSGRKVSLERSWMRAGMSCPACQCTSMPCHGTDGSTSVANVPIRDTHVHVCIANIGTETFFENRAHSSSGYLASCVTELVCLQAGIAVQRLVSKQVPSRRGRSPGLAWEASYLNDYHGPRCPKSKTGGVQSIISRQLYCSSMNG
jgi:hypothetical protein